MRTFALILFAIFFSLCSRAVVSADTRSDAVEQYRMQGLEAQQQGLLADALAYFTKALRLDPDRADLYNDLGVICERMDNPYQAQKYYFESLNVDKNYLPAYSNLALLCKKQGNLAQAAKYFHRRIELGDPADPWTRQAVEELRALSQAFPEEKTWLDSYEADFLERRSRVLQQQLEASQDQAMAERLKKAEQYIQQAKAYEAEEMYVQALAEYDKAMAETPDSPRIPEYRRLALLKQRNSQVKQLADAALEKLEAGDNVSSKEDFRQILAIIPDE